MGNSASNANHPNPSFSPEQTEKRLSSPARRTASPIAGGSPSSSTHRVHRSLRSKKKSLELPDLASLTLTPASSSSPKSVSPYRRASSPIPIPVSAAAPVQTFRVQNALPSAAHIPISPQGRGGRHKSYLSSAYPSTHSFVSNSPPRQEPHKHEFIPEVIHSVLPLAVPIAEEEDKRQEPVSVSIKWRGGGRSVLLARAGDDNWKGRQPMDYDLATNTWSTPVNLLPGTHHFKFIVDDQWRLADDYAQAVDDRDGSLANYVNVTAPTSSSPQSPSHVSPMTSPYHTHPNQFHSFWSDSTSTDTGREASGVPGVGTSHSKGEAEWTTVIPPELIQAAAEEENYLANAADSPTSSSSVPAPNIPPAPVLPRHLDRLILNSRPTTVTGSPSGSVVNGGMDRERERTRRNGSTRNHRRGDRDSRGGGRSALGMTATLAANDSGDGEPSPALPVLPVVTASGTDLTAALSPQPVHDENGAVLKKMPTVKLDGPGLSDDASVLPVPNHVVLHHLSTSAIRNGVLAVANTTRYRKKYITTILYKPT